MTVADVAFAFVGQMEKIGRETTNLYKSTRKSLVMNLVCYLIIKDPECSLEFDYIKHTYQDACCLYNFKDERHVALSDISQNQLFLDFKKFLFLDFEFENSFMSKPKEYDKYHKLIFDYIEAGGNEMIKVERVDKTGQ